MFTYIDTDLKTKTQYNHSGSNLLVELYFIFVLSSFLLYILKMLYSVLVLEIYYKGQESTWVLPTAPHMAP